MYEQRDTYVPRKHHAEYSDRDNLGTVSEYLCRFLHKHGNIATQGSPKSGLCPMLLSHDFIGDWGTAIIIHQIHYPSTSVSWLPSRHKALNQCWFNVGPTS